MKILFYGLNYSPELIGVGKYTGEMAEWLAARGHECRVVTAPPYYPDWKVFPGYRAWKYSKEKKNGVVVYRSPLWVPKHPRFATRLLHLFSFSLASLPTLFCQWRWKPEVVICIAPSFLSTPQGLLFSKLCKARSWLHFQDFEICAMFGSGLVKHNHLLDDGAHFLQKIITRQFDRVSSISHHMCNQAEKRGSSKNPVLLLPNWVDTDFMSPDADRQLYRKRWQIKDDRTLVLYSGNLGDKQGLDNIIRVASDLRECKDIIFAIVGDGACKTELMKQAQSAGLKNVVFHPLQAYETLPNLLTAADLHLILQKRGSADAVLPSKLSSILSVGGQAIITADPETELGQLVNNFPGIAILIPPEDFGALKNALVDFYDQRTTAKASHSLNPIARKFALENLNKDFILTRFEKQLEELAGK